MNYKNAVQELSNKPNQKKVKKSNYEILMELPKGWILLKKDGSIYDNRTQEEIDYDESYYTWYKLYSLCERFHNRFINNIILDKLREGYNEEEIEAYIDHILNDDDDYEEEEEEEIYSDNDYYSNNEYDSSDDNYN